MYTLWKGGLHLSLITITLIIEVFYVVPRLCLNLLSCFLQRRKRNEPMSCTKTLNTAIFILYTYLSNTYIYLHRTRTTVSACIGKCSIRLNISISALFCSYEFYLLKKLKVYSFKLFLQRNTNTKYTCLMYSVLDY